VKRHPDPAALGTLLRHVLEELEGDVAACYRERGLPEYRPRFSPVVRVLLAEGPQSVRDLAAKVGVTHSAASQTAIQMARAGLVAHTADPDDSRRRLIDLTPKARRLVPQITAEWEATTAAIDELDKELSMPLAHLLIEVSEAIGRRPLRDRIAAAFGDEDGGQSSSTTSAS
jgi:DNA-binding MarR family transcriptional regulator